MSPDLCLHFAGVVLSYFLQVAAAYLACCLLDRLLHRPQQRFLLWMVFLLGSGTYWLGLLWSGLHGFLSPATVAGNISASGLVSAHSFQVPQGWSHSILLAGRIAGGLYISVVGLLLGVAVWRHLGLRLLLRRAIEPSPALAALFHETRRDLMVSASRLLVLPGLRSPATACWWNPRILLPEVCEKLGPTPQLADVMYHELVHVARRDYLWAGASDLICRLLFFHPAAWMARKRLRLQGELACDLAVVEARPGHRADYADSLAFFVRLGMLEDGLSAGVDFAGSGSTLGTRIRSILAAPQPLPWWKAASRAAAGLVLVASVGVLSPALKVLLDFTSPPAEAASVQTTAPAAAPHHRSARRAPNPHPSAQPQPYQDSLTSLHVQPVVGQTSAYALTPVANTGPDAAPGELDLRGWSESRPSPRTVTSAVVAAVRQIPVARLPRRDHDHEGH